MRAEALQHSPKGPEEALKTTEERSHNLPPFAPQFQKYISFCPVEVSQNPDKTQSPCKKILIFAPFQPFLPSFGAISVLGSCRSCADAVCQSGPRGRKERQPLCPCCRRSGCSREDRGRTEERKPSTTQQNEEHNRTSRPDDAGVLPMLPANRERKPTRKEGTQQGKREGEREREREAERGKPTSPQRKGHPPPIAKGRPPSPSSQIRAKKSAKSRLG